MRELTLIIDENNADYNVGEILKKHFKLSSRLITKLKQSGGIILNGEVVTVRKTVKVGDTLCIVMPQSVSPNVIPVNLPLNILYEDQDILAVNKPKNMPVHPSMNNYNNTLGNAVMYYYKNSPFVYRPVNRLDRDTTGIVIIAKTPQASHDLSRQMQEGEFKKEYLAILSGTPSPEYGIIDAPIKREQESIIKRCVDENGQKAITEYVIIDKNSDCSVAHIKLHTGRTHQVRVHFAHIGHPLMYDYLYGIEEKDKTFNLHCYKLTFFHPVTKEHVTLICNPPEQFNLSNK
ncbi:MAG: RluA family pseudouridine synthase [Clostridia bacterium]|nr:RluA family pseudouridine synthase [Clostridia bacterium]